MGVDPQECKWHLSDQAHDDLHDDRNIWGEVEYADGAASFKEYMCEFFSGDARCARRFGSISTMGSNSDGGKILKMRWLRPGEGARGGYRFAVVVYCDIKKIVLCRAFLRQDDPSDEEFEQAAELARRDYSGR